MWSALLGFGSLSSFYHSASVLLSTIMEYGDSTITCTKTTVQLKAHKNAQQMHDNSDNQNLANNQLKIPDLVTRDQNMELSRSFEQHNSIFYSKAATIFYQIKPNTTSHNWSNQQCIQCKHKNTFLWRSLCIKRSKICFTRYTILL